MTHDLPAISGPDLIKLLTKNGWTIKRRGKHGLTLIKKFKSRTRVTTIPTRNDSLPKGTLMDILGREQTNLGKDGLRRLLRKK